MTMRKFWKYALWLLTVLAVLLLGASALAEDSEDEEWEEDEWLVLVHDSWVVAGNSLDVTIAGEPRASKFSVELSNGSGERVFSTTLDGTKSFTVPGSALSEAGIYRLSVVATEGFYTYGYAMITVYTTPPSEQGVTLTADKLSGLYSDTFWVSAYAPGSEEISFVCDLPDYDYSNGDDYQCVSYYAQREGTFEVYAVATYPDGSTVQSETLSLSVVCYGQLPVPEVDLPFILEEGKPLSIFVPKLEVSGETDLGIMYSIRVADHINYEDLYENHINHEQLGDGVQVTVDAAELEAGAVYDFEIEVWARGWEGNSFRGEFVVVGEQDANATLYVNGMSEGEISALLGENFEILIMAPGATAIRLFNGRYFTYLNESYSGWEEAGTDGRYNMGLGTSETGDFVLFAQVYYGDDVEDYGDYCELPWGQAITNPIRMVVKANGKLPPAKYRVPETVVRGEILEIEITQPSEGAERYFANAFSDDTGCATNSDAVAGNRIYMSTADLEPGAYELYLTAQALGMEDSYAWDEFEVLPPESEGIVFSIAPMEVQAGDRIKASCYMQNAESIALYYKDLSYNEPFTLWTEQRAESLGDTMNLAPGIYEFYAVARDSAGEVLAESEHVVVTVHRKDTSADLNIVVDAPSLLRMGDDYVFSVSGLEKADYWQIHVCDQNYNIIAEYWTIKESYTVPAELFKADELYDVRVFMRDVNFDRREYDYFFYVTDGMDEQITVTVNGQAEAEALVGESFTVTYSAPGAKALYVNDGDTYWDLCNGFDPQTGLGTMKISRGSSGRYTFLAKGYYGDLTTDEIRGMRWEELRELDWGEPCQPAVMNVISLGRIGRPVLNVPKTVVRGDLLPVTVLSADGATLLDFSMPKDIGDGVHEMLEAPEYDNVEIPFTAYLPTADLEPGDNYSVIVWASAPGYEASENDFDVYRFTVLEPRDEINLQADRTTAKVGEKVWVTVFAPGAEEMRLDYRLEGDESVSYSRTENGEYLRWDVFPDVPGTYVFTAAALYDGEWREAPSPLRVLVTADDELEAPVATYSDILVGHSRLSFSFTGVKGAETYRLEIYDAVTGEMYGTVEMDEPDEYTLDGGILLDPGRVYTARLTAFAEGKRPGVGAEHDFAVVEPDRILILPANLKMIEEEAFAGTDAQMIVVPDDVTGIGPRAFDAPNLIALVIPDSVTQIDASAWPDTDHLIVVDSY